MRISRIVLAVVLCVLVSERLAVAQDAAATTTTTKLQELIDKAKPGGEVIVPKGEFRDPLRIDKPLKLRGADRDACVIDVTSDEPAIRLAHGKGDVTIENLTVRWRRATSNRTPEAQAAITAKDGGVHLRNLRVIAPDNFARCPAAFSADGFADVKIDNCTFDGYEFTIAFGGGAKGAITDTVVTGPGHCGITAGPESTVNVARTIVTGSRYHAVRCTGGELNVRDSVLVANKNRGVYLGNKSASGTIANNVIRDNGSGISGFAESDVKIHNNLIAGNEFSGVDMRDTCRLNIARNLLAGNGRAVALFPESGTNRNMIGPNASAANKTEAEGFKAPPATLKKVDGELAADALAIEQAQGFGLSDAAKIKPVWERWTKLREEAGGGGAGAAPAAAEKPAAE